MNCKPGDLAVIVRSATGPTGLSVGRIVRCIRLSSEPGLLGLSGEVDWGPVWETDDEPGIGAGGGDPHSLWMDKDLRPIRDPGDDAVDESAAWLPPVPTGTKAPKGVPA